MKIFSKKIKTKHIIILLKDEHFVKNLGAKTLIYKPNSGSYCVK